MIVNATNNKENFVVYSTKETKCGVWHDGRPIYRKVIETNVTETNKYSYLRLNTLGLTGCTFIKIEGVCYEGIYTRFIPLAYRSDTGDSVLESASVFVNNEALILTNRGVVLGKVYLTVEYVK